MSGLPDRRRVSSLAAPARELGALQAALAVCSAVAMRDARGQARPLAEMLSERELRVLA